MSSQGSIQAVLCPCLIGSWWRVGEQHGQASVSHTDIQARGKQLMSIYNELGLGLRLRKSTVERAQALEEERLEVTKRYWFYYCPEYDFDRDKQGCEKEIRPETEGNGLYMQDLKSDHFMKCFNPYITLPLYSGAALCPVATANCATWLLLSL